ncbi:MAG TPA: Gfo/Idh/MocA family oxidoreductase [Candidatus Hydrogenedentes bacterium]|mgnify:CR=1 FL=1|nr:Gfo/Idh/MocA family oxidoreductase [Candidatus Hydrogenedentota bacterium]HOV72991.1 Gfo/Idh/MocA family oxidoreductase [Candidatus Hydrogenedentota bacterium]HPC15837.1 Gfo/Idh/MocA family oxidoreductase [Candidatus Hydrogenedentota bacterium]HRT19754.1 Gfo/Idh/MocA family oxidoreductase [Candidatus Hydrogenedentota bacterium]HRT64528.1 Gfo/Idh/MocA family oxidoreductase [Candidatus Hydrogenedentota bacterium]
MGTFRLGYIGAGFIAKFQAKALQCVRGIDLVGVHALKGAEELAAYARENGLGDCKVYSTVEELCNRCDAVAVFAPNFARIEIVERIRDAVKAGAPLKGVICEKPLGRTVAEARRLVELGREMNLPTAYFENQIHMKTIAAQLAQLAPQQRSMGPFTLSRAAEEHAGPHEGWFWDPTKQGGGVLCDMACHCIAAVWYVLTPLGKPVDFLQPVSVTAETALLKWGQPQWRKRLLDKMGVDYGKVPAEDFATGLVTFRNPDNGQLVKGQFTSSWMYDKQGMRLSMDALGPGYAFEMNSLQTPLQIFIGDEAADAAADVESALEKSTASRGLLPVEPNEADLYGYTDEHIDACRAFAAGKDAKLNWAYGLEITKLCQAAYMAAERGRTLDLTAPDVQKDLESYVSLIAQGRGGEILFGRNA